MNEQEAIEVLSDFNKQVSAKADGAYQSTIGEMACKVAIKAMEQVQQYRAIGTVEQCRAAVEKQSHRDNLANMILQVYYRFKEVSAYVLLDKFDFDKDMLTRVEQTMDAYIISYVDGEMSIEELKFYCEKEIGVSVEEISKRIPQSYKLKLAKELFSRSTRDPKEALRVINGVIQLYFALTLTALHSKEGLSSGQIGSFVDDFSEIINSLQRVKQTMLTQQDIHDVLKEECGYEIIK